MPTLTLRPPPHLAPPYDIAVGCGNLRDLPSLVKKLGDVDRTVVLTDRAVLSIARTVAKALGTEHVLEIPSGEQSKNLANVERLTGELLAAKATRKSLLVAVGGGVTTDLGGFLASVYMRGIRVIHVPTSLLAMVDASMGGKTAVDAPAAKNVLGTVHHPSAMVADIETLRGLPDEQMHEGLVEAVKMAAILDAGTFAWLEKRMPDLLAREEGALEECVVRSLKMKADVVTEDERDTGRRLFLNFGHTVGHAVEVLSEFRVPHGQAVSMGMVREMAIAGTEDADRVLALLRAVRMPIDVPKQFSAERLWEIMRTDKKAEHGIVRIAVATRIGEGIVRPITFEEFASHA